MIGRGSWLSAINRALHVLFYLTAFISLPVVTILALYIGFGDSFVHGSSSSLTMWTATKIILQKPLQFLFSPESLSADERNVLFAYGNALVLFVSIFAVVFSSYAVFGKLSEVQDIVPFDSYIPRRVRLFGMLGFLSHYHRTANWYFKRRGRMMKNFAARTMLQYYHNADSIIIVSGDYSWLFDNKWSEQLRRIVKSKLNGKITLISYKRADQVLSEWRRHTVCRAEEEQIFRCIAFECDIKDHQSSIIETAVNSAYIHLYKDVRRARISESICVFYSDREAGDLIRLAKTQMTTEYRRRIAETDATKERVLKEGFHDP